MTEKYINPQKDQNLEKALAEIQILKDEIKTLRGPCVQCTILKEITKNMIESLRCLEEDNKTLKENFDARAYNQTKKPSFSPPISLQNSFGCLKDLTSDERGEEEFTIVKPKRKRNYKQKKTHFNNNFKQPIRTTKKNIPFDNKFKSIPFKSVSIIGDSHVRGLAAVVKSISRPTASTVSGVCKPGAGLLDIKPTSTPPRDHCYVVMAGTNDVDAGREEVIYRHLEDVLQTCKKFSKVLVIPMTTRFDLDLYSPVHDKVTLLNNYMAELCFRYQDVELLDTSSIRRLHHTKHGLHLNNKGKRHLAHLIMDKLACMRSPQEPSNQPAPAPVTPVITSPPTPRTLPFETYAKAVSQSPHSHQESPAGPRIVNATPKDCCRPLHKSRHTDSEQTKTSCNFLGTPLQSNILN